jgi:ubiquinone biosynthesis protein
LQTLEIANIEGIARQLDPSFAFVEVARPVVTQALQRRVIGAEVLPEVGRSSLYFSQLLLDLPLRLDVLTDRLERSELGLVWRWRDQGAFQEGLARSTRRLTLGLLSVGCLLTGGILSVGDSLSRVPPQSDWLILWHQSFLIAGVGIGVSLVTSMVLRP